jgi:hypothetical protein
VSTLAIVALVTGLLVAIPAFWCLVVLALSYVSGWQKLAASYLARETPRGTRFSGQSGSVGSVSYRSCLTVHVAPDGLFLATPFFFRFAHKPLFIPWSAIRNQKRKKFLWHEAMSFEVGPAPAASLRLPTRIFEERVAIAAAPSSGGSGAGDLPGQPRESGIVR